MAARSQPHHAQQLRSVAAQKSGCGQVGQRVPEGLVRVEWVDSDTPGAGGGVAGAGRERLAARLGQGEPGKGWPHLWPQAVLDPAADRSPRTPRPKQEAQCRRCGGTVPRSERVYCDDCLPHYQREQYREAFYGSGLAAIEQQKAVGADPTHGGETAASRAKANVRRKRQAREWDEAHGKLVDLSAFERDILPLIQNVSLSRLQRATGLSLRYVSLIRRGERTPHPRHWQTLLAAAGQR